MEVEQSNHSLTFHEPSMEQSISFITELQVLIFNSVKISFFFNFTSDLSFWYIVIYVNDENMCDMFEFCCDTFTI